MVYSNVNDYPTSPEGDQAFDAEFSVNGSNNNIRLTNEVSQGSQIIVIKRQGKIWNTLESSMSDSENVICNFLKIPKRFGLNILLININMFWPPILMIQYFRTIVVFLWSLINDSNFGFICN